VPVCAFLHPLVMANSEHSDINGDAMGDAIPSTHSCLPRGCKNRRTQRRTFALCVLTSSVLRASTGEAQIVMAPTPPPAPEAALPPSRRRGRMSVNKCEYHRKKGVVCPPLCPRRSTSQDTSNAAVPPATPLQNHEPQSLHERVSSPTATSMSASGQPSASSETPQSEPLGVPLSAHHSTLLSTPLGVQPGATADARPDGIAPSDMQMMGVESTPAPSQALSSNPASHPTARTSGREHKRRGAEEAGSGPRGVTGAPASARASPAVG
jgi:hypothetical protein